MEKEKFYTYYRHGVAYRVPITPGMTKDMMRAIYRIHGRSKGSLEEKDMFYVRFPETTYTKMTKKEWEVKGKPKEEEINLDEGF